MKAWFGRFAEYAAHGAGSVWAILLTAVSLPVCYVLVGRDTTNLIISILSLVLLFLLQGSANRDSAAIEAKLDEIVKAIPEARNLYIGLDREPLEKIEELRKHEA